MSGPQGNEIVLCQTVQSNGQPSPYQVPFTTAQIASLAAVDATPTVETVVTTNVGTTLAAAALVGGQVNRSGPTAAYTDTTDSAANIVAALPAFLVGAQFYVVFKNATTFNQTLAAGANVTLPGTVLVPPLSESNYFATVGGTAAAPTVTFTHVGTTGIHSPASATSPQSTALNTVGAATIPAVGIVGGVVNRGGVQAAAFTDTTDTAANIITLLGQGSALLGQSASFTYVNNTIFPATIAAGANVTLSGQSVVPANAWIEYLVTYSAAGAVTMQAIASGYFPTTGTFVANGATAVVVANAALTANSSVVMTLKTIGGTPAGAPFLSAVTPGTGFSVKAAAGDTSTYIYEIRG